MDAQPLSSCYNPNLGDAKVGAGEKVMTTLDDLVISSEGPALAEDGVLVCLIEMEKWAEVIIPGVEQGKENAPLPVFEQVNKGKNRAR
ncbi:hypothetical protein GUJ93_ZPchr0005g15157 [Zizania palustris]|uniref:Uncharacterized protein n=1 Tax=Zizania palustris TaxID=103762 RepID=A0A8J5S5N3_ZIZPA|nr:hypothetical protein GUJ93_ZPchr0005g15157 [Zizania palustris]